MLYHSNHISVFHTPVESTSMMSISLSRLTSVVCLFGVLLPTFAAGVDWEPVQIPNGPSPASRVGATVWTVDNNLFLFGGRFAVKPTSYYNDNSNEIWTFSTSKSTWERLQPLGDAAPGARHDASSFYDQKSNNLWIFGGFGVSVSGESGLLNDLWRFSISERKWTRIGGSERAFEPDVLNSTNSWPGARKAGVMWGQNSDNSTFPTIFVYGGRTAVGTANLVWEFHPNQSHWISHPARDLESNLPGSTRDHASAIHAGTSTSSLMMYGGWSESEACPRNALWSYDVKSFHWTRIYENRIGTNVFSFENDSVALLWPLPRRDFSLATSPQRTYVAAGQCISLESPWCAPETSLCFFLWEYRPAQQQWTPHESSTLSSNLLRPQMWITAERLYLFSGIQSNTSTLSSGFWSLTIPSMSSNSNPDTAPTPSFAAEEANMWLRVGLVMVIGVFLVAASIVVKIIRNKKRRAQSHQYELHPLDHHEEPEERSSSSIHT